MLLSIRESKIHDTDYLTQCDLQCGDVTQTVWIKTNFAEVDEVLVLKDDPREWRVVKVYVMNTQLASTLHQDSESIWETQPIQRGNK